MRLFEMAMTRRDAIRKCGDAGDVFLDHFLVTYENGVDDVDFTHHCNEMYGQWVRVNRIRIDTAGKPRISEKQLEQWFFNLGAETEDIIEDPDAVKVYQALYKEMLKSRDNVDIATIMQRLIG